MTILEVGVARVDITPTSSVHLAGFTRELRMSSSVLDPLFVRAIVFAQGERQVLLLVFDTLLITKALSDDIQAHFRDRGVDTICIATHTHSAHGGYWAPKAARMTMGPFVEGTHEALVAAGVQAGVAAIADRRRAQVALYSGALSEIAINRRDNRNPADDLLWSLRLHRPAEGEHDADDIILCGFAAHPIIVATKSFNAISADFPGRVVSELEKQVGFAVFINGPVGGTGTVMRDEVTDPVAALGLQADPIAAAAMAVMQEPSFVEATPLGFARTDVPLPTRSAAQAAFDDQTWARSFTWALNLWARRLFNEAMTHDQVQMRALALGPALVIGTPADTGINVGRAIRELARASGFGHPFVVSQADGYIGYLHRRDDYRRRPDKETLEIAMYENLMGIFGHDMGERLIDRAGVLVQDLATGS